jgi:antitoxin component YwqK of YwqJK toxin-antitoxin module
VYEEYWDDAKTQLRIMSIYVDNLREGLSYEYYEDGTLRYERPYVADKRQGMQKEYDYLGRLTTEREYKDDRAEGLYINYYAATGVKSATGNYVYFADTKLTQQHGHWVSWHENGLKSKEGDYDRGLQTGTWRYYYVTGELEIVGAYAAGKNVGTWTWYNTKGEVMRTHTY